MQKCLQPETSHEGHPLIEYREQSSARGEQVPKTSPPRSSLGTRKGGDGMATPLIPKSMAARIGQVVHDIETHEDVIITEEMVSRNQAAKARLYSGFLQIAQGLADIRDHRLYVVDQCHSFEEWITNIAGMSRQKVYNYLRIVDKYANPHGIVRLTEKMEQLGISKLLVATMLPGKDFERFKRTGDIEIGDGRQLHVEEIRTLSVCDFETAIRAKTGRSKSQSR